MLCRLELHISSDLTNHILATQYTESQIRRAQPARTTAAAHLEKRRTTPAMQENTEVNHAHVTRPANRSASKAKRADALHKNRTGTARSGRAARKSSPSPRRPGRNGFVFPKSRKHQRQLKQKDLLTPNTRKQPRRRRQQRCTSVKARQLMQFIQITKNSLKSAEKPHNNRAQVPVHALRSHAQTHLKDLTPG